MNAPHPITHMLSKWCLGVLLVGGLITATAEAGSAENATKAAKANANAASTTLTSADVHALLPILRQHELLALVSQDARGKTPMMTVALRIHAPRNVVFDLFRDPDNFYYISTLFKENTQVATRDNAFAWTWASRHKLFSFTGTNSIALHPPGRADIKVVKSTVGSAAFSLAFLEDGPEHTLFVIAGYLDVQTSEWLIRHLIGNSPSMKRAMNAAIAMVIAMGTRDLAESVHRGRPKAPHRTGGKAGGIPRLLSAEEMRLLAPFTARGTVLLSDSHAGKRLRQISVIEAMEAPAQTVLQAAAEPHSYARHIRAISGLNVLRETEQYKEFSWELGFSVFKIRSTNRLVRGENDVVLSGIDGDLMGARWRWQVQALSPQRTLVAYHGYADVGATTGIMRTTVRREPYLEHGVMAGSNLIMMNAMKKVVSEWVAAAP